MERSVQQRSFQQSLIYYSLWARIWFWHVPGAFARRWYQHTSLPIFDDIIRTIFRTFFNLADVDQLRRYNGSPAYNAAHVLDSPRFSPYKHNLYHKVVRDHFSGYWIVQGDLTSPQSPLDSDIVLYHFHGGGYVCRSVANDLTFLLAIWESTIALNPRLRLSIFALEYDLAPEVRFPGQLRQAAAGYDYLVGEMGIDPSRIIFSGDSAGGHLAVSLVLQLHTPLEGVIPSRILKAAGKKPGGVLLISPWLDIFPTKPYRLTTSAPRDVLDDPMGRYWARCFADSTATASGAQMAHLRPLECGLPWKDILPVRCALTTGTDDLLRESGLELRRQVREAGADVEVVIEEGQVHGWQWGESTVDLFYLQTRRSKRPEHDFKGAEQLARILASMAK